LFINNEQDIQIQKTGLYSLITGQNIKLRMKKHCLALDLNEDPALIAEYEAWHKRVWPEVKESIIDSGIVNMEIFRTGNRLFMIMETDESFSFERKSIMDAASPKVQEWEDLMWKFQQPLPWAKEGEKWILMDRIFQLQAQDVRVG
jgi:L-rhamnose mutarotase